MRIRGDADKTSVVGQVRRFKPTPWRDPRLIAGACLVTASTALGGWALAAADHTVTYWATGGAVHAGDPVARSDLMAVRAKVPKRTSGGLVRTDATLPARLEELTWAADADAGTLVARTALVPRRHAVELPISVGAGGVPADVAKGDRVDVWGVPDKSRPDASGRAHRLLSDVRVMGRTATSGISGGPGVTLVVDVAGTKLDADLMGALATQRITVVRLS